MTDIEHAKKYAEDSISLVISMNNPKAEIIAEYACLYGLTYKNDEIDKLKQENEQLKQELENEKQLNAEIKKRLIEVEYDCTEYNHEYCDLSKAKSQIEKMKICENCKDSYRDRYHTLQCIRNCINFDNWELAE